MEGLERERRDPNVAGQITQTQTTAAALSLYLFRLVACIVLFSFFHVLFMSIVHSRFNNWKTNNFLIVGILIKKNYEQIKRNILVMFLKFI